MAPGCRRAGKGLRFEQRLWGAAFGSSFSSAVVSSWQGGCLPRLHPALLLGGETEAGGAGSCSLGTR